MISSLPSFCSFCSRGIGFRGHKAAGAELAFGSLPAGAGLDPAYNLPKGIRPECNSSHRLSGEVFDLRFGLTFISRQGHPLADDLSALLVFRLHARLLPTVGRAQNDRGKCRWAPAIQCL
jgi:hypothetical protein